MGTFMMLESLRLLVLSALYYFGFTYAAFTALKQRATSVEVAEPSELSPNGRGPHTRTKVLLGTPALKLMIMLTFMALLSFIGADWFPLFAEMRVIFMYTLLFTPPFTQQEIYDQLFGPLLVRGGTFALSLQTSNFFSGKVPLFVVRCCVSLGIAAMNYTQRCHVIDEDAVRDIVSGLVFSKRALQQVADLSRERDGATYAAIARDSNFAVGVFTSHVRRALVSEQIQGDQAEEPTQAYRHQPPYRAHGSSPSSPPPAPSPQRGRVVDDLEAWYAENLPIATAPTAAATATASPSISSDWQSLDEQVHSPRYTPSSTRNGEDIVAEDEGHRARNSRREKHRKKNFFGLF